MFASDGPGPPSIGQRLFNGPLLLVTLWILIGIVRQGVFVEQDGLRVRNIFRTYRLDWDDIDRIDPPRKYGVLRNTGIQFSLRDGHNVSAALYAAGPLNRSTFADETVNDLRHLLAEHRS
jgi:Bacterial PH domain